MQCAGEYDEVDAVDEADKVDEADDKLVTKVVVPLEKKVGERGLTGVMEIFTWATHVPPVRRRHLSIELQV